MASKVIDFEELGEFSKALLHNAKVTRPKETKKFVNQQGYALRRKARELSKQRVRKKSGAYHKGWKKGKLYRYKGDKNSLAVRVYNANRYAHVIENGRRYHKDGAEYFKKGAHVLEDATKDFTLEYYAALDGFLDEMVKSI